MLEGAFLLLEALAAEDGGLGLSELSRRTNLPKTTVLRLVDQLRSLGALDRQGQYYLIGPRLGRLGRAWQPSPELHAAARGPCVQLARLTATDVALCALRGSDPQVVSRVAMAGPAGSVGPGTSLPQDAATALVLLGTHDHAGAVVSVVRRRFVRDSLRSEGVVFDHEQVLPGVSCVAGPVYGPDGAVIASVGVVTNSSRSVLDMADQVRAAADQISRALRRHGGHAAGCTVTGRPSGRGTGR